MAKHVYRVDAIDVYTGVDKIRFTFHDIAGQGTAVYQEIDVFGAPTVIPDKPKK